MISVLIVDDSEVERAQLCRILESESAIRVVATADTGARGVHLAAVHRPDVVVMDWHMPGVDGLAATREIMKTTPLPVLIVSETWDDSDFDDASHVYRAGAVAGARKPCHGMDGDCAVESERFVKALRRSAVVKVSRLREGNGRRHGRGSRAAVLPPRGGALPGGSGRDGAMAGGASVVAASRSGLPRVVAIGVSTGGPPVLESILSRVPAAFPAPVLIVQHIAEGFVEGLIEWLQRVTPLHVQLAVNGDVAYGGNAYVAQSGLHLGLDRAGRIVVDDAPAERSQRPAVSYLFRSVAASCGAETVAIVLTGMGSDGAPELKALRDLGATTIAQDERSCTVFGMPAEAIKLGAARYVLSPEEIGDFLCRLGGVASSAAPTHTKTRVSEEIPHE